MAPRELKGTAAADGVFAGPVVLVTADRAPQRRAGSVPQEIEALETAIAVALESLAALMSRSQGEAADMLAFQIAMLEDETLRVPAIEKIYLGMAADRAWADALDAEAASYDASDDAYFRGRASDLKDMRDRVLRVLTGGDEQRFPPGSVLLGRDLPPSVFLSIDWSKGGAIALAQGSRSSHVAMLARARGIPMVVGLGNIAKPVPLHAAVDGNAGTVVLDPQQDHVAQLGQKAKVLTLQRDADVRFLREPAHLADGTRIQLLVNVAGTDELQNIVPECCDGIGLMRSEFLFRDGAPLPEETQQYDAYCRFLEWADGRPVTIRTLDAGGDKPVRCLTPEGETNPFLGRRGVRLTLARRDVFRTQLRALARSAVHGDLKIMIPMVTVPEELAATASLLRACIDELEAEAIPCRKPALGIMVEVPAVAVMPDLFAEAAFFSIGSNDLTQYVTAAARDCASVQDLADPGNAAVVKLIRGVAQYGESFGIPVSLCGDMASEADHLPALLSAGLRTLSVAPSRVARIKAALSRL